MPVTSGWSESEASKLVASLADACSEDLALRTYTARLLGREKTLVLHGGGNTSVKGTCRDILGRVVPAIFVKASGHDLASIEPEGHVAMRLDDLRALRNLAELPDEIMLNEMRTRLFYADAPNPSIEALMHAFIPAKFIDHTHADAIITLTNQCDGERIVREALGSDVVVLDYVRPGFDLAKAAAEAYESSRDISGIVLMKHGLVTWGENARQSYERTVDIVNRAEGYVVGKAGGRLEGEAPCTLEEARKRYVEIAPVLRGLLALQTGNADWPYDRFILKPLITREVLGLLHSDRAREVVLTPPLTADHLIRTKPLPLWVGSPSYGDPVKTRQQIADALGRYRKDYDAYVERHSARMPQGLGRFDSTPRVVLMPGLGAVCVGRDADEATIVSDITESTLAVKGNIASIGQYEGLSEEHLFDMEYHRLQAFKLDRRLEPPLRRSVALVTGAAGAIGAGVCEGLLEAGCHVAVTDLPGDRLTSFADKLARRYGERVAAVSLDVKNRASVASGFDQVVQTWGGVDLVIANAGLAHVASLADMSADAFLELEKVNVEGTLNVLSEAARRFELQATGGDIVLVSTKNVFAPGARFGAYSATKAAAHQLARVASLELAALDVRVNMVSPDAVFSHGDRKSGLWSEVGPERMRARGLDEDGLERFYQDRNLLKAQITATHVANAVLFFATRRTPTTGATFPVDGGLPDATPR